MTQWNRLSTADLQMVQHITEVGMYVGEVKMVSDFLVRIPNLMDHPTEAKEWYDDAVIPLMDKLRELMKKLEEQVTGENGDKVLVQPKITQEPFRSFFRTAICVYLAYVLGGKESVPSVPPVAVGCGCEDCDEMDEFIRGPEVSCRFEAALGERRLDHILSRVKDTKANELVDAFDDESTMEPCSMIIEKKREVVKQYTWAGRQSEAVKFLKHAAHGGEREMMELLGKKAYECAVKAIHGVRPFELSDAEGGDEEDEDEDTVSGDAKPQVPKVGEDVKTNEEPIEVERSDETMVDEGEGSQGDRPAKRKREE
ncbi:hypothetical protein NMY22_g9193 [Coprinellus aureogranulatus]|nr:hypothetical protein NMY22_g9193 [Coprinellus aureogranulatus]